MVLYRLKPEINGKKATQILESLLRQLGGIDPSDLTSFEFGILNLCSENPPKLGGGAEKKILDGGKP